ncbi:MAG: LacI family DNA-binding transcriptional regulator [Clostridia bacterium]|nr:LacI family DNA-binding transcriptional regulator [Clostridia bacterium]
MAVTIKDIAQKAGVGVSTVSRVLNNSGYVSAAVREKVLAAVLESRYQPNANARNLKINSSRNIGLFVKGIANPFFNKMIRIIEEKCALQGYTLTIKNVNEHQDEMKLAADEARSSNLCGVILMGGVPEYSEAQFRELGVPCVLTTIHAGDSVPKDMYSSVYVDDEKECRKATEYLISIGHRRIGFIYDPSAERATPNQQRFIGYQKALAAHQIPYDQRLVADIARTSLDNGYAIGFNAVRALYAAAPDMTAVVAFSDVMALGAMKGIFSLGLKIPENISVIGFDGIEAGEYYQPSLDTIVQPAGEMALSSIQFLFDMIRGGQAQHLVYDAVLARRGSTMQKK